MHVRCVRGGLLRPALHPRASPRWPLSLSWKRGILSGMDTPYSPEEKEFIHRFFHSTLTLWYWAEDDVGYFLPDHGVERRGENPGLDFGHPAYAGMREVAWLYRAERNAELQWAYERALYSISFRLKKRTDVNPDHVDHVMACLMEDRCPCPRCRYSY